MNGTLREATVRRYYYGTHDELRAYLQTFLTAYNFARRLKALKGMMSAEYIAKCWTEDANRFKRNPNYLFAGLSN